MDSYSTPPAYEIPPEPVASKPRSGLGLASTILAGVSLLAVCVAFVGAIVYGVGMAANGFTASSMDSSNPLIMILGLLLCTGPLMNLIGIGLGIAAVVQTEKSKTLGIIGLVANILLLCAVGGFILFSTFANM